MKQTIKMHFEKSTKNTHKYSVAPNPLGKPAFSEIYIQKAALGVPLPATIHVTVDTEVLS